MNKYYVHGRSITNAYILVHSLLVNEQRGRLLYCGIMYVIKFPENVCNEARDNQEKNDSVPSTYVPLQE